MQMWCTAVRFVLSSQKCLATQALNTFTCTTRSRDVTQLESTACNGHHRAHSAPASFASFATVFMFRAVPVFAAGIFNLERAMLTLSG